MTRNAKQTTVYVIHRIGGAIVVRRMPEPDAHAFTADIENGAAGFDETARIATAGEVRGAIGRRLARKGIMTEAKASRARMGLLLQLCGEYCC